MKLINKIANILMPIEEVDESFDSVTAEQRDRSESSSLEEKRQFDKQEPVPSEAESSPISSVRSRLSVHANKVSDMKIFIFKINAFDEVKSIADALKQKRAALVNYEKVDTETQKRICDFINGVCYVLNGEVKRISNTMVLYAPENITIGNGVIRGADGMFRNDIAS
ncbi:cell division protein SepF [Pectinatus haikarae]|uniref:Cell division protein SepF n=1 Tax=Pectinatus haikarae TaxID=349096 RepID=A0ABT9YBV1_9FIRM|nr:cell division protein SepF [Pectinatus haikarae]MDQ0205108.1 cell division inhibitor SepF [Pectinatus haikarae]